MVVKIKKPGGTERSVFLRAKTFHFTEFSYLNHRECSATEVLTFWTLSLCKPGPTRPGISYSLTRLEDLTLWGISHESEIR